MTHFSSFRVLALTTLLPVAIAACTVKPDTNAVPGETYKYPTVASFCTAIAEAECSAKVVEACYSATSDANTQSCVDVRSADEVCRTIPGYAGADLSGVAYHPEAAEGCVDHRRGIYADAKLTMPEIEADGAACRGVFSKDLGAGARCSTDIDCSTTQGLTCVLRPGEDGGTCAVPVEVDPGLKCEDPSSVCTAGFFCDGAHCVALGEQGDPCDATTPCVDATRCVEGTCTAKAPDGQACSVDGECAGGFCNFGSGDTTGLCGSVVTIQQFGAVCDDFRPN